MSIRSDLSVARFKTLALKYFLIISGVIPSHASRIHFSIVGRSGSFEIGNYKKQDPSSKFNA